MDEHVIAPRRTLPPVPPAQRTAPGTTLAPPVPASPVPDETSWYDPQDLLADSLVHTDLGPLAPGTARQAAHDLVRESGRMLVLDEQLLAALDAAAKAAEARRALTAGLVPTAVPTGDVPTAAAPATGPATTVAPVPTLPPLAGPHLSEAGLDAEHEDDDLDDGAPAAADPAGTALVAAPAAVDVAAEFARHDDLVETGRHAALEDDHDLRDDQPADDDVPALGTLTHRTVVTRGSGRRWIPVGVGAGVLSIVAAVLLTSGLGTDQGTTGTDEAARTGAASTSTSAPSATPSTPAPAMNNTIDLSGPVATGSSPRGEEDTTTARPTAAPRTTATAGRPQVATPPVTPRAVTPGGTTGAGGGSGTPDTSTDRSTTTTPTATTTSDGTGGSTGTTTSSTATSTSSSGTSTSSETSATQG